MTIGTFKQVGAEVLIESNPTARMKQVGAEVLLAGKPMARFHQVGIEVIRTYTPPDAGPPKLSLAFAEG